MQRVLAFRLVVLAALVLALGPAPGAAGTIPDPVGGSTAASVLEHLTDVGSAIRLGFGVAPLRGPLAPAPAAVPGVQEGETATVVSFDLNLTWPGAGRARAVEPYLVLGPALFVVEPDFAGRLLGTRVDPTLQLGARAGAGLNWRVGKRATLFGGYEITTTAPGGLPSSSPRGPAESGISGYDFTYGLRFLY
jgi:hypothetical protein